MVPILYWAVRQSQKSAKGSYPPKKNGNDDFGGADYFFGAALGLLVFGFLIGGTLICLFLAYLSVFGVFETQDTLENVVNRTLLGFGALVGLLIICGLWVSLIKALKEEDE